jgi:hypothetical protein
MDLCCWSFRTVFEDGVDVQGPWHTMGNVVDVKQ